MSALNPSRIGVRLTGCLAAGCLVLALAGRLDRSAMAQASKAAAPAKPAAAAPAKPKPDEPATPAADAPAKPKPDEPATPDAKPPAKPPAKPAPKAAPPKSYLEEKVDPKPERRLTIPGGPLGLEGLENWVMHRAPGGGLFSWMQSIDAPDVALIVASARSILPDYHAEVNDVDLEDLEIAEGDELGCLVVLREPTDYSRMTANLLGPIIVNTRNRRGVQVVLHGSEYSHDHQVMTAVKEKMTAA